MIGFLGEPPIGYKPRRQHFPLRGYQEELAERWKEHLLSGGEAALGVLPTGTGKQWVAVCVANRSGRTLFIAHRDILLAQPMETAKKILDRPSIGLVKGDSNELFAKNIVFASIQTISRENRLEQLLAAHKKNPFQLIVYDEAHHSSSKSAVRVLDALHGVPRLGLTATPVRSDKKGLAKIWGVKPIYHMTLRAAIDEGYLVEPLPRPERVESLDLTLAMAKFDDGDFDDEELEKEMFRAKVSEAVAAIVAKVVNEENRKTIVFTVSVNQAKRIAELLNGLGVPSASLSYLDTKATKASTLAAYKTGKLKVIANAQMLTEGFDETAIDYIVVARPTFSTGLYSQMVGRGLRPHPGKKDCLVIDIVGAHEIAGLITIENLDMDGESKPRKKGEKSQFVDPFGDAEFDRLKSFTKTAMEDLEERKKKGKFGRSSANRARAVWINVNDTFWALSAGSEGHLLLIKENPEDESSWMGYQLPKESWNLFEKKSLCSKSSTQDIITGVVEDKARTLGVFKLSSEDSLWRKKPPTTAQISILTAAGVRVPDMCGECADAITVLKMSKMWANYLTLRKHVVSA